MRAEIVKRTRRSICVEIAVFVLNLSDVIFLRTAPHKHEYYAANKRTSKDAVASEISNNYTTPALKLTHHTSMINKSIVRARYSTIACCS